MLDQEIKDQIKELFKTIDQKIELAYDETNHEKQEEMLSLLRDVASSAENISLHSTGKSKPVPGFKIRLNGNDTGIGFLGIPGGHEFSSFALAILNLVGMGKLPDQGIIHRISNLKGTGELKTYVSLSCENCPEVVQALNLVSIFNPNFSHTMIDGEFAQAEIERLKIQGVPSVVSDEKVLSVGKSDLGQLLDHLEEHFGVETAAQKDLGIFDVVVIGGGPAGASAAIYSSRKGLKTAMISENIGGQVKETRGIENLISVRQTQGPELAAQLAAHMGDYEIEIFEHRRVSSITGKECKEILLSSGETLSAKSVIISTGATWRELGIPGEKEYVGRGVGFCPHCDGPFFKGKRVGVVGGGNSGVEAAIDLAGIVSHLTLFEFLPELKADQVLVKKLQALENVEVVTNAAVSEVIGNGSKVIGVKVMDRETQNHSEIALDGVFVQIGLKPNSSFVQDLVQTNASGEIIVDENCRTNVKGVYAAGDVTTVPFKQIIISMGEGAKAALSAFHDQMLLD